MYFEKGSVDTSFSAEDLKQGLFEAFGKMGAKTKVLAVPPDYTRFPSRAGELTEMTWEYFGDKLTDILPALGTHSPMTSEQIRQMFCHVFPGRAFRGQCPGIRPVAAGQ